MNETKDRNLRNFVFSLMLPWLLIALAFYLIVGPIVGLVALVVVGILYYVTTPKVLNLLGAHKHYRGRTFNMTGKKALIICTNHEDLGYTGKKTGIAMSEHSVPFYEFSDSHMEVDVASIKGGRIPIDEATIKWPIPCAHDKRYLKDREAMHKLTHSLCIDDLDFTDYDAIYMVGGWGASYDLGYSEVLGEKLTEAYANNAVLGSVCHGALGLLNVKKENGEPLLEGLNATGVTDKQIREFGITITPMHPETELRKAGARFSGNSAFIDFFSEVVVVDSRVVTGQNQNTGAETAQKMMMLVEKMAEGKTVEA